MRQASPEAESIFNLILALYSQCKGNFASLFHACQLSQGDLKHFQDYAAIFLANLANYTVGLFFQVQAKFVEAEGFVVVR
jgi:dipeptidyl-peptidase-3